VTRPPEATRAEAAAALLAALRDVRDANERLQLAAAWVFEAFGDTADAETIRMLPVGVPGRPSKPPVPTGPRERAERALMDYVGAVVDQLGHHDEPPSVTGDESPPMEMQCARCGHGRMDHVYGPCDVSRGGVRVDDCAGFETNEVTP
jgi:hypothetical protein